LDDISVTPIPAVGFQSPIEESNSFNLTWITASGLTYQVEYTTNLSQPWHAAHGFRHQRPPIVVAAVLPAGCFAIKSCFQLGILHGSMVGGLARQLKMKFKQKNHTL
jgi:hypothetical protein